MVLEKNIQQEVPSEVSQKDKTRNWFRKQLRAVKFRTSDCEPDTSALSHQKGSTVKESVVVETDNHEKYKEKSMIQEPEVKLPTRKKRVKKPAAKNQDESLVKGADNIVSETSLIVPATTVDEKINAEMKNDKVSLSNAEKNEGLEKTLTDDVTMQEAETSKPTEVVVETSKPTEVV
ncbi:hypothetical protein Tco_1306127, partial [Tanacetum coccineum]